MQNRAAAGWEIMPLWKTQRISENFFRALETHLKLPTTLRQKFMTISVGNWSTAYGNGDESLEFFFWKELFWISQNPHLSEKYKLPDLKQERPATLVLN